MSNRGGALAREISPSNDDYFRPKSLREPPVSADSYSSFDSSSQSQSRATGHRKTSRSPDRHREHRGSSHRYDDRNGGRDRREDGELHDPRRSSSSRYDHYQPDEERGASRRSPEVKRKRKSSGGEEMFASDRASHRSSRTERDYERSRREDRDRRPEMHGRTSEGSGRASTPPRSAGVDRRFDHPARPDYDDRRSHGGGLPYDSDRGESYRPDYSSSSRRDERRGGDYDDRDRRNRYDSDRSMGRSRPREYDERPRQYEGEDRLRDGSDRYRDERQLDGRQEGNSSRLEARMGPPPPSHHASLPDRPSAMASSIRTAAPAPDIYQPPKVDRQKERESTTNGRSSHAENGSPSRLHQTSSQSLEPPRMSPAEPSSSRPPEPSSPPPLPSGTPPAPPPPISEIHGLEDPRDPTPINTANASSRPLTRAPTPKSTFLQDSERAPQTHCYSSTHRRQRPRRHDPEDDEQRYGRTFKGIARLADFDRPMTEEEKRNATLGKGTFGVVTKATRKSDGQVVALKLLQAPQDDSGKLPSKGVLGTTIREIKVLKLLDHPNVVPLLDIVIDKDGNGPELTFLVFPYMDHDLCGLLKNPHFDRQSAGLLKLYMLQLLEGLAYMHRNHIVHRDLKSANILINNQGQLQIADFGLARAISSKPIDGSDDPQYTNMVVTRWYRAPELFMGEVYYGAEVDMWSVGCILGEMRSGRVLMQGASDPKQLDAIFDLCGTPPDSYERYTDELRFKEVTNDNLKEDPRKTVPVSELVMPPRPRRLREDSRFRRAEETFLNLLDKLLAINPKQRISAAEALSDRFFWSGAAPTDPSQVLSLEASKERRDQQEEQEAQYVQKAAMQAAQSARYFAAQQQQRPPAPAMNPQYGQPMAYQQQPVPNYGGGMPQPPSQQQPPYGVSAGAGRPMMGMSGMGGYPQQPPYPQMPGQAPYGQYPMASGGGLPQRPMVNMGARPKPRFVGNRPLP